MENFLTLAEARYSVRRFEDRPIASEHLEKILEAGRLAPTACNNQPQKILVIESEEALAKLKKCTRCHFDTRCALLVCYDSSLSWNREFDGKDSGDVDASIVTTHMMLEAAELGVGSTWVMYFMPEAVKIEFALPENIVPTALLVLGYPAEDAKPSPKHKESRPLSEMVFRNSL